MFECGEIDLQKMCQGFVAHMTVRMVVPLADAENAERTALHSLGESEGTYRKGSSVN